MARVRFALLALALAACGDDGEGGSRLPAYLASDPCSVHGDAESCAADTTNGCSWAAADMDCPAGVTCPTGICSQPDPCREHSDDESCAADTANGCAWAEMEAYCPMLGCGEGGFCYGSSGGDDCVCACPAYCPEGEDCPPCACDCDTDGSGGDGGGTCTCACPECAPGEACPPCACDCTDDGSGSGCVGDGTCTCVCPECPPGTDCPPCACDCEGSDGGGSTGGDGGTCTCACPDCPPGTECPPCECGCTEEGEATPGQVPPSTVDPCAGYVDEAACLADTANSCTWVALGVPCSDGAPDCRSGVCYQDLGGGGGTEPGGGGGCACVCPDCPPDATCPPCECDCGDDFGCGTTPGGGGSVPPSP